MPRWPCYFFTRGCAAHREIQAWRAAGHMMVGRLCFLTGQKTKEGGAVVIYRLTKVARGQTSSTTIYLSATSGTQQTYQTWKRKLPPSPDVCQTCRKFFFPQRDLTAHTLDGFYAGPSPDVVNGGGTALRQPTRAKVQAGGPSGREAGDRWCCGCLPKDVAEERRVQRDNVADFLEQSMGSSTACALHKQDCSIQSWWSRPEPKARPPCWHSSCCSTTRVRGLRGPGQASAWGVEACVLIA